MHAFSPKEKADAFAQWLHSMKSRKNLEASFGY